MNLFDVRVRTDSAAVDVDFRFRIVIRRNAPPPMASAQLVLKVYPITNGQAWIEPYETFVVDEGRIVELELQLQQKDHL